MTNMLNTLFVRQSKYSPLLIQILLPYALAIWFLWGADTVRFDYLHVILDTGIGMVVLLLVIFLLGEQHESLPNVRKYLAICFGFTAAAELLHVFISMTWGAKFVWIDSNTDMLFSVTWLPAAYILPISLGWAYWLKRTNARLRPTLFAAGVALLMIGLLALSYMLPSNIHPGRPDIWMPAIGMLLLIWVVVVGVYWRARNSHPLFEGLALMGALLFLADLPMLYSDSPNEKFAMMAHAAKLAAFTLLLLIQMRIAVEDRKARGAAEYALYSEKERLQVMLGSIEDGVITTDAYGRINSMNPVAETLTGWKSADAQDLLLEQVFKIVDEHTRLPTMNPVVKVLQGHHAGSLPNHSILIRRDGAEFSIEDTAAPLYDNTDIVTGVVVVFHDVSFARKVTEKLSHQATHDALTSLVNRTEFEVVVSALLCGSGKSHVLLYLDLDQFKLVNDTCGHMAGDEMLRKTALMLQGALREEDVLARLGGDEFAVLIKNCTLEQGERIAEKLRGMIEGHRFMFSGKQFNIGASIGLVAFTDHNQSFVELLRAADSACYLAKEKGRNRVHVYRADSGDMALRLGQMEWVGRIHSALEKNRFILYRQLIDTVRGDSIGVKHYEVLLRMRDEENDVILPMTFIPSAEVYGLMPEIDRWVIHSLFSRYAMEKSALWSINLSGASINDENFLDFIREQFELYAVPPQAICFEITETAAIASLSRAGHFIRELRAMGCKISLDDFGSGMSSFAYLKYLPVDFLKIDGGFVKDMLNDRIDRAMVEAINKVGQVMGLETIAEYVESEQIRQVLREIGVHYVQGYAIGRPEPF